MTIASTANRNDYTGSNSTLAYPYGFRIFSDGDIQATVRNIVNGAETPLVKNVDFTVGGVGNLTGGNVNLIAAGQLWITAPGAKFSSAYELTLRRVRPLTQLTDIRNQGDFFPEIHEDSFDHAIMIAQQHQDEIDRAVKLPETLTAATFDPTLPAALPLYPGSALIVNPAGNGFSLGLSVAGIDVSRIFGYDTYAEFKSFAVAQPMLTRIGYAIDIKQVVFYTADITVGDAGWVVLGG